jgi:hypothetical protein
MNLSIHRETQTVNDAVFCGRTPVTQTPGIDLARIVARCRDHNEGLFQLALSRGEDLANQHHAIAKRGMPSPQHRGC